MAAPTFAWIRRDPKSTTLADLVAALNRTLPTLTPALNAAVAEAQAQALRYTTCRAEITASDDETVTVRVTGTVPLTTAEEADPCHPGEIIPASLAVFLRELVGTTVVSGGAVDVSRPNANVWVLTRPVAGAGPARATFESVLDPAVPDRAVCVIPEVGSDVGVAALRLVSRVTASDEFTVTTQVTLTDEGESPVAEGTITVDDWGGLDPDDATPASVTGPLPLTQSYVISRPLNRTGQGRALWKGTAAGRLPAYEPLDVPEIAQDTIPLYLEADLTGGDATTAIATASASDPRDSGTPVIVIEDAPGVPGGVAAVVDNGDGTYTVPRPTAGADAGRLVLRADMDGRVSDRESVPIPPQGAPLVALHVTARVVATFPLEVHVAAEARDPKGGAAPSVTITSSVGIAGTIAGSGSLGDPWKVPRPGVGEGQGEIVVRASKGSMLSDENPVTIAPISRDTVTLAVKLTKVGETSTTVRYRVESSDPLGGSAPAVAIIEGEAGVTGVGTLVNPYVVPKTGFGLDTTRFTVEASKAGRVSNTDSVDVPAIQRDTATLRITAALTATGDMTATATIFTQDPVDGSTVVPTVASSFGVPGVGDITDVGGGYYTAVINRPSPGGGQGRVDFTVSKTGRVSSTDSVDVAERVAGLGVTSVGIELVFAGDLYEDLLVTAVDPFTGAPATASVASAQGLGAGGTGGVASLGGNAFRVYRPAENKPPGRVTFNGTASGRMVGSDSRDISPRNPAVEPTITVGLISVGDDFTVVEVVGEAPVADGISQTAPVEIAGGGTVIADVTGEGGIPSRRRKRFRFASTLGTGGSLWTGFVYRNAPNALRGVAREVYVPSYDYQGGPGLVSASLVANATTDRMDLATSLAGLPKTGISQVFHYQWVRETVVNAGSFAYRVYSPGYSAVNVTLTGAGTGSYSGAASFALGVDVKGDGSGSYSATLQGYLITYWQAKIIGFSNLVAGINYSDMPI